MRPPLPVLQLPAKVMVISPVITSAVVKAAHGEPTHAIPRLDRAIAHTELLLDELKCARLVLARASRRQNIAEPSEEQRDASLEEIRAALLAIEHKDAVA